MKIILASPAHKKRVIDFIDSLPYDPQWSVECKIHKATRSLEQNNLYWEWLTVIKKHVYETLGEIFTEEDLHDYYRKKFLPVTVKQMGKEEIVRLTSTTKLNVTKMSEYMTKIDHFCVERLNLLLPTPDMIED